MYPARLAPLFAFAIIAAQAAWLDESKIKTAAAAFPVRNAIGSAALPGRTLADVTARDALWVARYSPSGHAVFSGSDLAGPVVVFGTEDFVEPDEASAFFSVLAGASEGCRRVESKEETADGLARREKWAKLLSSGFRLLAAQTSAGTLTVKPFMTTRWSQWQPYNDYAPVYAGIPDAGSMPAYRGRVPCGCVATAMAQVFRYWRWPARLDTVRSYRHPFTDADGATRAYEVRFDGHVPFNWDSFSDSYGYYASGSYDLRGSVAESTRYPIARLVGFCALISEMEFDVGGSASDFSIPIGNSPWYSGGTCHDAESSPGETLAAARADIAAGRPVLVAIPGHAVIGHGWMEDDSTSYIYLNYGWGGSNGDGYYNFDDRTSSSRILSVNTGFMPRPTAQIDPLPLVSSSSVTLNWHVPDCWTNVFAGYSVIGRLADMSELTDFYDGFENENGTSTSELISIDRSDESGGALGIQPPASGAYAWGDRYCMLTARSVLTYNIRSQFALGLGIAVEASFNGGDWTAISTPTLAMDSEELPQRTERVFLGGHGGDIACFRIRSTTTGQYYIMTSPAVTIDDFRVTEIHPVDDASADAIFKTVPHSVRSYTPADLEPGLRYMFTVKPLSLDGSAEYEESKPVFTTVAGQYASPSPGVETYAASNLTYSASAEDAAWSVSGTSLSDTSFTTGMWDGGFSVTINGRLTSESELSFGWTATGYYASGSAYDVLAVTMIPRDGAAVTLLSHTNAVTTAGTAPRPECKVSLAAFAGMGGVVNVSYVHEGGQYSGGGMTFHGPRVAAVQVPVLPDASYGTVDLASAGLPSIESVSAYSPAAGMLDGFYRECSMSGSVILVQCNDATESLAAYPSAISLLPDSAVTVADLGAGRYAVEIDAGSIPDYAGRTRMILTLAAANANGTKVYKDLSLRFSPETEGECYVEVSAVTVDGGSITVDVPYSWLEENGLVSSAATHAPTASDYENAASADSDGDGMANWKEYVCGTDPNDADERLVAAIRIVDGEPVVTHNMDSAALAAKGFKAVVQGKTLLTDAWTVKTSAHRFFRVVVETVDQP